MRLKPERAFIVFHCLCEIIIQNCIRFNARGSFKISQPFCQTVSVGQICRGRGVLSENCISIVFVGVVNQRELAGPFLISGTNFFICYPSTNGSSRRKIPPEEQLPYQKAPKIDYFQSKFDNTCRDLKKKNCSKSFIDPSSTISICYYLVRGVNMPMKQKNARAGGRFLSLFFVIIRTFL